MERIWLWTVNQLIQTNSTSLTRSRRRNFVLKRGIMAMCQWSVSILSVDHHSFSHAYFAMMVLLSTPLASGYRCEIA